MNEEFRDDCPSPEILRFANAYRGLPGKMFTLKNRSEFIAVYVLHERAKKYKRYRMSFHVRDLVSI